AACSLGEDKSCPGVARTEHDLIRERTRCTPPEVHEAVVRMAPTVPGKQSVYNEEEAAVDEEHISIVRHQRPIHATFPRPMEAAARVLDLADPVEERAEVVLGSPRFRPLALAI